MTAECRGSPLRGRRNESGRLKLLEKRRAGGGGGVKRGKCFPPIRNIIQYHITLTRISLDRFSFGNHSKSVNTYPGHCTSPTSLFQALIRNISYCSPHLCCSSIEELADKVANHQDDSDENWQKKLQLVHIQSVNLGGGGGENRIRKSMK